MREGGDRMTAQEQKAPKGEDRYLLVELSCKDWKCSPCTYPNCQRFARLASDKKKKPFKVKVTEVQAGKEVQSLLSK